VNDEEMNDAPFNMFVRQQWLCWSKCFCLSKYLKVRPMYAQRREFAHEGKELGCNTIDAPLKISSMFFCSIRLNMSSLEHCFIVS